MAYSQLPNRNRVAALDFVRLISERYTPAKVDRRDKPIRANFFIMAQDLLLRSV